MTRSSRRRGGTRAERGRRMSAGLKQSPWRLPRTPYRPVEVLDETQIKAIHDTSPVEPVDLPPETRHLDGLAGFVTPTGKVFHTYSLGRERILDPPRDRPHLPRPRPEPR